MTPEDKNLAYVIAWCRNRGLYAWHTENERKRNKAQAAVAKKKGLLAGVADVLIMVPRQPIDGYDGPIDPNEFGLVLAVELKMPGEKPRPEQRLFLDLMDASGDGVFVGDGEDAVRWIWRRLKKQGIEVRR